MGQAPINFAAWDRAVSETIRAERAAARLTQEQASERSGIPRSTYLRYESGARRPDVIQVAAIARAFGLSLSTFVERVEGRVRA